jgi:hypothetical protein
MKKLCLITVFFVSLSLSSAYGQHSELLRSAANARNRSRTLVEECKVLIEVVSKSRNDSEFSEVCDTICQQLENELDKGATMPERSTMSMSRKGDIPDPPAPPRAEGFNNIEDQRGIVDRIVGPFIHQITDQELLTFAIAQVKFNAIFNEPLFRNRLNDPEEQLERFNQLNHQALQSVRRELAELESGAAATFFDLFTEQQLNKFSRRMGIEPQSLPEVYANFSLDRLVRQFKTNPRLVEKKQGDEPSPTNFRWHVVEVDRLENQLTEFTKRWFAKQSQHWNASNAIDLTELKILNARFFAKAYHGDWQDEIERSKSLIDAVEINNRRIQGLSDYLAPEKSVFVYRAFVVRHGIANFLSQPGVVKDFGFSDQQLIAFEQYSNNLRNRENEIHDQLNFERLFENLETALKKSCQEMTGASKDELFEILRRYDGRITDDHFRAIEDHHSIFSGKKFR